MVEIVVPYFMFILEKETFFKNIQNENTVEKAEN